MGDLLVLPHSKSSSREFAAGATAEILFFTGVRYYRMEESLASVRPEPPRKRRRAPRTKRVQDLQLELHS